MTTPLSRAGTCYVQPTYTKFEMSTITCIKEMKGNGKCINSRFELPFGGLRGAGGNAHGSSMARW